MHVAVIGSSPLLLVEAEGLLQQGHEVTVLDAGPQLGGAWRDVELEDGIHADAGCYMIQGNDQTYRYLADRFGLEFERMKPNPFMLIHGRKRRLAIDSRYDYAAVRRFVERLIGRRPREPSPDLFGRVDLRQATRNPVAFAYRNGLKPAALILARKSLGLITRLDRDTAYPVGGVRRMIDAMVDRCKSNGARFQLNARVVRIEPEVGRAAIVLEGGSKVWADHVVISAGSCPPEVKVNGVTLESGHLQVPFVHAHAKLRRGTQFPFSHVHVVGDNLLLRVSNLQTLNRLTEPWILMHLHASAAAGRTEDDLRDTIRGALLEHRLLPEKHDLESLKINTIRTGAPTNVAYREALAAMPSVTFIEERNFSRYVYKNMHRWGRRNWKRHIYL